jgi:NTP pyrophosphatase (non-canonical NTP hydrolase)
MTLNERVKDWAEYVGMISDGIPEKQMQKIAEEVIETTYELGCFEKHLNLEGFSSGKKLEKELGDILFATKVACYMMGFDPDECLEVACYKNDKRRDSGRMINGNFYKKEDLTNEEK